MTNSWNIEKQGFSRGPIQVGFGNQSDSLMKLVQIIFAFSLFSLVSLSFLSFISSLF